MTVKEFKEYLNLFRDNDLIINVIQSYLRTATNTEVEVALQTAFDRLKSLAWEDKSKRIELENQLEMTKTYLKGELYTDEETATEMLYKQILNIEEVLKNE